MQIVKPSKPKRPKPEFPRASCKLSTKATSLRRRILTEWQLTDSDTILLDRCLLYLDQADGYQAMLDKEGLTIVNKGTGASRPHPALAALKLARNNFLAAWRLLNLKDEAAKTKPGRPPAIYPGA